MSNEPKIIVVNESDAASILSDVVTFGLLVGGFWANHAFIGDGVVLQLVLGFAFFMAVWVRGSKKVLKRMNMEEAREYFCKEPTQ